jgi:HSP20 family molecular chaperone IbpA
MEVCECRLTGSQNVAWVKQGQKMSRMTPFGSPVVLGFDAIEKTLERMIKGNDGYPPYNIERLHGEDGKHDVLRITIAVAGFSEEELDVTTVENQLIIRGRQQEQEKRDFLYRGIAARQFQRVFVLAEGMKVGEARLRNGLLSIDLVRPEISHMVKKINISVSQ